MGFFNKLLVSALFITLMVSYATAQATGTKENPGEDWLTGTWKGVHQARYLVNITIRFQYDPTTGRISGDADLANTERPVTAKGVIRGEQKSNKEIAFTLGYIGGLADGKITDFTLERKEDGSLAGSGYMNTRQGKWVDLNLKKVD